MVPELKEACAAAAPRTVLRIEQLLGLPPGNGKTLFVEMEVPSDSLFRPCADPSTAATRCRAAAPTAGSEHAAWFLDLMAQSYTASEADPYPWTRLGYTYDWAPGAPDRVGLSELVVRAGTEATVLSVVDNETYCGPFAAPTALAAPLVTAAVIPVALQGGAKSPLSTLPRWTILLNLLALAIGAALLLWAAWLGLVLMRSPGHVGIRSDAGGFGGGLGGVRLSREAVTALLMLLLVGVGGGLVATAATGILRIDGVSVQSPAPPSPLLPAT